MNWSKAKEAAETLYDGTMIVTGKMAVRDETTGITKKTDGVLYSDVPCRLSFNNNTDALEQGEVGKVVQTVKVFCSPDYVINPGCKLTVTQAGKTQTYEVSGQPAVFHTHQEIYVEIYREYA